MLLLTQRVKASLTIWEEEYQANAGSPNFTNILIADHKISGTCYWGWGSHDQIHSGDTPEDTYFYTHSGMEIRLHVGQYLFIRSWGEVLELRELWELRELREQREQWEQQEQWEVLPDM